MILDNKESPMRPLAVLLVVSLFVVEARGQCTQAPSGIVSWWRAEGNAVDEIGCTGTATTTGAPTYATGLVGQTFLFDSDDDRVTIGHNESLNVNLNTGFSVECWIKAATSQPGTFYNVVDKSHGFVDNTGWTLQSTANDGRLAFVIGAGGPPPNNFLFVPSLNSLLDDTWHHVAGTWDPGDDTIRLYVDAVLQGTVLLATPGNNTRDLLMGHASGGGTPNRFYRGAVDEVSVYSRALSQSEVQAIFNAGASGKCIPPSRAYCTSGTSASGCQALLSATGTASATASSGFDLTIATVEGDKDGLFFIGTNGRQAKPWGSGTSFRCVVPPVKRLGLLSATGTPGACDGSFIQDVNATWCSTCSKPNHNPGVGALVQAQFWYRDPFSSSNQTTSFSDAIEFCVAP
jgi:hypothetical protein